MARKVILVATAPRHSATAVMILVISPRTAKRKLPHQGQPIIIINPTPTHIITTAAGTGHTPSIPDASKGTVLTSKDHAINPSMTEVPVTIGDTHPTLYPTRTAILGTPLWTGTLKDTPIGIPHTTTSATHPDTCHTGVTLNSTQFITVGISPGILWALPTDCTQRRPHCHKRVIIQDSQMDSSLESDDNLDTLNY